MSTAITRAPEAAAIITAESPTPPQPWTATHSPGATRPCATTARNAVAKRQPSEAAVPYDSSSGSGDQVHVGVVQSDVLGVRAPVGEARLGLPLAHLLVPGRAGGATAAGADEGGGHAVAGAPAGHRLAGRLDDAGEFVAGDVREGDVGVVTLPAVPVAAAEAGGFDPDDDSVRRGHRVRHLPYLGRLPVPLEHHCPHVSRPSAVKPRAPPFLTEPKCSAGSTTNPRARWGWPAARRALMCHSSTPPRSAHTPERNIRITCHKVRTNLPSPTSRTRPPEPDFPSPRDRRDPALAAGTPRARIPGPQQPPPSSPRPRTGLWKRCLWGGLALWALAALATYATRNTTLLPTLILLGSFLVPVVFVLWAYEHHGRDLGVNVILGCFLTGGVLGVLGASMTEYYLLRPSLWMFVGGRAHRGGREARGARVRAAPPDADPRTTGRARARRVGRFRLRGPGERRVRVQRRRLDRGHRPAGAAGDRDPAGCARPLRARTVDGDHGRRPARVPPPRTGTSGSPRRWWAPASASRSCTPCGTRRTASPSGWWRD